MLFSIGISLSSPWKVVKSEFLIPQGSNVRELHIWIDFERGTKFMSSKGTVLSPHDTVDKEWRHLNFFEHPCYLHARVPRLKTDASSWFKYLGHVTIQVLPCYSKLLPLL